MASLRKNASLYSLAFFQSNRKLRDGNINVVIGLGFVRFEKQFTPGEWFQILAHLNHINENQPTRTTDDQNEASSKAFRQYMKKESKEVSKELDAELCRILFNAFENNDFDEFQFELTHKYSEDFYLSPKYELSYGRDENISFSDRPSLQEVLSKLRGMPTVTSYLNRKRKRNKKQMSAFDKFKIVLQKTKFAFLTDYRKDDDDFNRESLMNFIEGNAFYEGRLYWRVLNKWCYLYDDYYQIIHSEYLDCLEHCLLPISDSGQLPLPWQEGKSEHDFILQYYNKDILPGYIMGDRITPKPHFIEIFDLLYVSVFNSKNYLYHIKDGFEKMTRDASEQLLVSLRNIMGSMSTTGVEYIETWHKDLLNKYYSNGIQSVPQLNNLFPFKRALNKAIFVLAFRTNSSSLHVANVDFKGFNSIGEFQSLHREKLLKKKVTVVDLKKNLLRDNIFKTLIKAFQIPSNLSNEKAIRLIANKIRKYLQAKGYINQNAEATAKLIYATDKIFHQDLKEYIGIKAAIQRILNLLKQYRTKFPSLIAKYQLIRTRREMIDKSKVFKVCEIFGTDKDGQSSEKTKAGTSKAI